MLFAMPRLAAGFLTTAIVFCAACSPSTTVAAKAPDSLDGLARESLAKIDGELKVPGLKQPVEIIRDQEGIPHIYARNDDDLFFAQGYVMAQDRLWQLEMWRRWREGRLARKIFGPRAFDFDARTRPRLMFRGPWDASEWTSLPPRCRTPLHRMGQWPERLRRPELKQPAGGIQADGHQAGAVDGSHRDAAVGATGHRQRPGTRDQRDPACFEREAPSGG